MSHRLAGIATKRARERGFPHQARARGSAPTQYAREAFSAAIAHARARPLAPPAWYLAIGTALAWPVGLGTYVMACVLGGLWGFLLGWIPAWITFSLSRWLWLPAAIYLASLAGHG